MLIMGSKLEIMDNSGIMQMTGITSLGYKKHGSGIGDKMTGSIKNFYLTMALLDEKQKKNFKKGTVYNLLIIRSIFWFVRALGLRIKFSENGVILLNDKKMPISNRLFGPILMEITFNYVFLISMAFLIF